MEKKYQIFISSTFKDLKTARLKVRDAILSMYHFPVGMEMFGALDEDQWEVIKRDIDASDYYVLIIGKMFGSEVPGEGISYTQKEFRYAVEQGIPVLAFLMKDDADVAKTFQETDKDRIKKLNVFRKEVETGRTVSYWSNPDELAGQVVSSLSRQIYRKPRPGWIRVSEFNIEKSHAELLELTDKVRALEEENEELKKITGEIREPKLSVKLYQPIKLRIKDPEPIPDLKEWYRKLTKEDAERLGIAKSAIMRFNRQLPDTDVIDELEKDIIVRSHIMAGFSWLDIVILNNGTLRATDISIEVEIPEGLEVYESIDMEMLTQISIPNHKRPGEKSSYPAELLGLKHRSDREDFPEKLISLESINGWDIIDNKMEISIDEIRHYSARRCTEFFVTSVKPGIYVLECAIMCAEYKEPDYQEIIVEVVKEG